MMGHAIQQCLENILFRLAILLVFFFFMLHRVCFTAIIVTKSNRACFTLFLSLTSPYSVVHQWKSCNMYNGKRNIETESNHVKLF